MLVTRVIGDCPGCGRHACYGNVDIYGDHVLRGCLHCRHTDRVYLPPVRKAVIYLDQFFFSGAFRGDDQRFVQAAERIRDLSARQLLIAPYSSVHEDETHQWARRAELNDFIKAASRGHEFEPAYDVQRTQVLKGFHAWRAHAPPEYELAYDEAVPGEVHEWDGYFRIEVGRYLGEVELIRDLKRKSIDRLVDLFPDWRNSTNTFEKDVALELAAVGKNYVDSYLSLMLKLGRGDYSALLNAPIVSMVGQSMMYCLPQDMPPDERLDDCRRYFSSQHFAALPYHAISARAFAVLKAMVKTGAYQNRERALSRLSGFFYDVEHIATYAPYCDAFVMDQPMAELMTQPGVNLERDYGVKVFSLNNWNEFFAWLEGLEAAMSEKHRTALTAAYP